MSSDEIVRSWKDPDHGDAGQYADHPAGVIALAEIGGSDVASAMTVLVCATWEVHVCPAWSPLCVPDLQ